MNNVTDWANMPVQVHAAPGAFSAFVTYDNEASLCLPAHHGKCQSSPCEREEHPSAESKSLMGSLNTN